jgi:hypothetical protein
MPQVHAQSIELPSLRRTTWSEREGAMRKMLAGVLLIVGLGLCSVAIAKDKANDKPIAAKSCEPDDVCGTNCDKTGVKCGKFTCDCKKGTAGNKCDVTNCK